MERPLRIGVAGVGNISRVMHLPNLAEISQAEVVALWSRNPDNLAYGASLLKTERPSLHQDYDAFLADPSVEAVLIATPDHLHEAMFVAAVAAGKHVYLEKSPATTVESNRRLREVAAATDLVTMIGLQNRYSSLYVEAAELLNMGAIGRLRMLWAKEYRIPFLPKCEDWILTTAGTGGSLMVKCIHFFDAFNWYAGAPPVRVMASGDRGVIPGQETLDHAWALVDYANGIHACLGMVLFAPQGERVDLELIGERGRIALSVAEQTLTLETAGGTEVRSVPSLDEHCHPGSRLALEDFIRCCRTGERPRASIAVGVEAALVALAAEQSVAEGRPISVNTETAALLR